MSRQAPFEPHPATDCVHAGQAKLAAQWGLNTPVVTSSAFDYRDHKVRYPRYHNTLNHQVVAARLARLEQAEAAMITASGMGAISAVFLTLMRPGDHAIVLDGIYGGTSDLIEGLLLSLGMGFSIWDGEQDRLDDLIRGNTRLIHVESPTNPLLDLVDLQATAAFAQAHGLCAVIDNTFATPIVQRPLTQGFDLVVHSATKYLGGHSDLLCGAVAGRRDLIDRIGPTIVRLGASLNGQDLGLLERSLKTLSVRVERQNSNAGELAAALANHPLIAQVYYPGLPDHPNHTLAKRQMSGFGAMISLRLAECLDAERFLDALTLIEPAVSLGGVESTICQPALTSHAKMTSKQRRRLGIDERLMRLSVGVEALVDLSADLDQALQKAGA